MASSIATIDTLFLGAKVVADAINDINDNLEQLIKSGKTYTATYTLGQGITHLSSKNNGFKIATANGITYNGMTMAVFSAKFSNMPTGAQIQVGFANSSNTIYEHSRCLMYVASDGDHAIQSVLLFANNDDHPYIYFTDMNTGNKSVRCTLTYKNFYLY